MTDDSEKWFYQQAGKQQGPVDRATLELLAQSGGITRQTLVWTEGLAEWTPAAGVRGLFLAPPPIETAPAPAAAPAAPVSAPATPAAVSPAAPLTPVAPAQPAAPAAAVEPAREKPKALHPPKLGKLGKWGKPAADAQKVAASGEAGGTGSAAGRTPAKARKAEPRPAEAEPAALRFLKSPAGLIVCGAVVIAGIAAMTTLGKQTPANPNTETNTAAAATPKPVKKGPSPEATRAAALAEFDTFVADDKNRPAFVQKRKRLDELAKLSDDEAWQTTILSRTRALQDSQEKEATKLADTMGQAALAKADAGDFKGALKELKSLPSDLDATSASARVLFHRKRIADKAAEKLHELDRTVRELVEAGNFDAALNAYDEVSGCGMADIDKAAAMRKAEIRDAARQGLNPSKDKKAELAERQNFYAADIYAALPGIPAKFDAALQQAVAGLPADAVEHCDLQNYPRSAVFYYIMSLAHGRDGQTAEAQWNLEQARRLALPSEPFRSRLLCAEIRIELAAPLTFQGVTGLVSRCQQALVLDPKNADAHFVLGCCQYAYALFFPPGNADGDILKSKAQESFQLAAHCDPAYAVFATAEDKYKYTGTGGNASLQSVVRISGPKGNGVASGTGFVVQSKGNSAYIVTNHHVLDGMTELSVLYQMENLGSLVRRETTSVKVLTDDPLNDLALLQIEAERPLKALSLRQTMSGLTAPMKITLIGHPKGLEYSAISGELSNLDRQLNGVRYLQLNANVEHGMSGGPVLDDNGAVIGVVVAKHEEVPGVGIAILSEHVRDLCDKAGITVALSDGKAPVNVANPLNNPPVVDKPQTKDDGIKRGQFELTFKERSPLSSMQEQVRRFHLAALPEEYDLAKESYTVIVPDDYSKDCAYGLLVWVDTQGDPVIPEDFKAALKKSGLIFIAARNCGDGRRPAEHRLALAIDAVQNMKTRYQLDARRIYAAGAASGANVATRLAIEYPDVFGGGGLFILECDRYKNIPSAVAGQGWQAQFTPDANFLASAKKNGRFVLIAGERATNRDMAKATYDHQFASDGFASAKYLEVPTMGNEMPPGMWIEKALQTLDEPLLKPLNELMRDAEILEKAEKLAEALESYSKVIAGATVAPDVKARAEAKVAELTAAKKKLLDTADQAAKEKRYVDAVAALSEAVKKFEAKKAGEAQALLTKVQREQSAKIALDDARKVTAEDFVKGYAKLRAVTDKFKGTQAAAEAQELASAIFADKEKAAKIEAAEIAKKADDKVQNAHNLIINGQNDAARELIEDVLKDYPNTPAAEEAKRLLEKIGK